MKTKMQRLRLIACGMLILPLLIGCATTTASVSSRSGFCARTPQPPQRAVGLVNREWGDWLTSVVGNYDCTCPGGKYYGKHDKICEQH